LEIVDDQNMSLVEHQHAPANDEFRDSESPSLIDKAPIYVFPAEIHTNSAIYCNPAYRTLTSTVSGINENRFCMNPSDLETSSTVSRSCSKQVPNGRGTGFAIGLQPRTDLWESRRASLSDKTSYRVHFHEHIHPFVGRLQL
jgi:hypothetical protein